jgi:hypothetical protein
LVWREIGVVEMVVTKGEDGIFKVLSYDIAGLLKELLPGS